MYIGYGYSIKVCKKFIENVEIIDIFDDRNSFHAKVPIDLIDNYEELLTTLLAMNIWRKGDFRGDIAPTGDWATTGVELGRTIYEIMNNDTNYHANNILKKAAIEILENMDKIREHFGIAKLSSFDIDNIQKEKLNEMKLYQLKIIYNKLKRKNAEKSA